MERNTVTLRRIITSTIPQGQIGAAGIRALADIPGVQDPRIENEADESVEISYIWTGEAPFWCTQEHLAPFGLERIY